VQERFDRTVTLPVESEAVWPLIVDFTSVLSWISVVGPVTELEPQARYSAVLEDSIGRFKARADLAIEIEELEAPTRIRARARGEDRQLRSRISIDVELRLSGTGPSTDLEVSGRYEITGRAATLGASSIRKKAAKVLDEFFAEAEQRLAVSTYND
jgi:carbon monoxide dehydrogenase subunit G